MGWITDKLGPSGLRVAKFLAVGLGFVALLFVAQCALRRAHDGDAGQREAAVVRDVAGAGDNASAARVEDAVKAEQQKEELREAVQATGDLDRQRALRGCVILRQQGRDTSGIAACGGH